ncbi:MAG TPA: nuclear transport factor 2 family protein [Acidimicrobiales bacterium]|nr:nuclear transport factor 2 family protein [Acidimicrobiales bacterium]
MGEDEDQVRRTIAAYSQHCDDGRFDQWSELFVDDAHLVVAGRANEGRGDIRRYMESVQPPEARGKHITANSLVEVDGDTAVAHTDYLFVRAGAGGLTLVATGRYHDQLVRDGSRWRFRRREITLLGLPDGSAGG